MEEVGRCIEGGVREGGQMVSNRGEAFMVLAAVAKQPQSWSYREVLQ